MGRILLASLGGVFFLVGAGLGLFLGLPTISDAKASKSWPKVDGIVIESRVEMRRSSGGANGRNNGPTYKAIVVYDYKVDDQPHSCDRIWFGSDISTSNRGQMRDTVKQYPEGKTIQVYYDPENPSEAVLQPGAFFSSYFMVIFGGVFAFVGGIILLVAIFGMGRKPADANHDDEDRFGGHHDDFDG